MTRRTDRLEDQSYYHGIRARDDVAEELKASLKSPFIKRFFQKPGDFLVRAAQFGKRTDIVINVLGENGLCNVVLWVGGDDITPKYCLNCQKNIPNKPEFNSVVELVNYFRVNPIPGGIRLRHGVPRPAWLIKHSAIQYSEGDKLGSGKQIFIGLTQISRKFLRCLPWPIRGSFWIAQNSCGEGLSSRQSKGFR